MLAQAGTPDRIGFAIDAGREQRTLAQTIRATYHSLPRFVDVVVLVECRIIYLQNENVAVPAVAQTRLHTFSKLLLEHGKPALRMLEGFIRPVELVCAERPVAPGQQNICGAEPRMQPAFGGKRFAAVITVDHKSR